MKQFKDAENRSWTITVDVDTIKRVRDLAGLNLYEIVEPKKDLLGRLGTDPVLLVDVLYAVCKEQADAKSVTDRDFGRAMRGNAIDDASTALLEGIVDFFPDRKRAALRNLLATARKVTEQESGRALAKIESMIESGEVEKLMQAALSGSSGNSPESSESTPALSPPAS